MTSKTPGTQQTEQRKPPAGARLEGEEHPFHRDREHTWTLPTAVRVPDAYGLSDFEMSYIAGPSTIRNMAGKIKKTSGKSILTGAF
jgi:hypothetical protein